MSIRSKTSSLLRLSVQWAYPREAGECRSGKTSQWGSNFKWQTKQNVFDGQDKNVIFLRDGVKTFCLPCIRLRDADHLQEMVSSSFLHEYDKDGQAQHLFPTSIPAPFFWRDTTSSRVHTSPSSEISLMSTFVWTCHGVLILFQGPLVLNRFLWWNTAYHPEIPRCELLVCCCERWSEQLCCTDPSNFQFGHGFWRAQVSQIFDLLQAIFASALAKPGTMIQQPVASKPNNSRDLSQVKQRQKTTRKSWARAVGNGAVLSGQLSQTQGWWDQGKFALMNWAQSKRWKHISRGAFQHAFKSPCKALCRETVILLPPGKWAQESEAQFIHVRSTDKAAVPVTSFECPCAEHAGISLVPRGELAPEPRQLIFVRWTLQTSATVERTWLGRDSLLIKWVHSSKLWHFKWFSRPDTGNLIH